MKTLKELLLTLLFAGGILGLTNVAVAATLQGWQGGTGYATTTLSNEGAYLTVASTTPFLTYTFSSGTAAINYWTLNGSSLYPTSTSYNVGIGTTTPANKLQVAGAIGISGTGSNSFLLDTGSAATFDRLDFKAQTTNLGVSFQLIPNGTNQKSKLVLSNSSSTTNFSSAFLGVEQSNAFLSPQDVGSPASSTNSLYIGALTGSTLGAGNWTRVFIPSGTVGIGTTTPSGRMEVNGGALTVDYIHGIVSRISTNATSVLAQVSTGNFGVTNGTANTNMFGTSLNGWQIGNSSAGISGSGVSPNARQISFTASSSEAMRIVAQSSGNPFIGIGTTTPQTSLDVSGSSTVRGNLYLTAKSSGFLKTDSSGNVATSSLQHPIQWIIESPTTSENDAIFTFRATSTVSSCNAINKTNGDTITFGLGYSSSRGTATSSLTNLFAAQTVTATTTPVEITPTAASSTPGRLNTLIFWTTAASSTQFTLTCFYDEN